MDRSRQLVLLLAVLLLMCAASASALFSAATLPGLKVSLSQGGLDYAKQVGLELVQKQFQTVKVPDQSGSAPASILGTINWSLTSIVLSGLSLSNSSSVVIQPNTGILVSLRKMGRLTCSVIITCSEGASFTANMGFGYYQQNWPHFSGGGSLQIGMSSTTISVTLQLGENSNQQPSVSVVSSSCNIGSLSVQESGGPSWLINFFLSVLSNVVKSAVQNAVGPAVAGLINNNVNQALSTIPMHQDFLGSFEVDYGFVAPPTLGKDYLTVNSRAEFYLLPNKSECPLTPGSLPNIANSDMVQVFMDTYVPNSALYVLYKGGFLQFELKQSDIKPGSLINLNTDFWIPWIPALAMYPNTTLEVQLQAINAPTAFFRPQGIDATAQTQLTVSVITNSSKAIPLFAFELDIVANATVKVANLNISGALYNLNCSYLMLWSDIGPITADQYDWVAQLVCKYVAEPLINYGLEQGIAIPTFDGVTLGAVALIPGQGYLTATTNVTYTPSAKPLRTPVSWS